jgi:peptidoglycan/LPS O-acetylase OafA/YrhL
MWGTLSKFAPLFVTGIMFYRLYKGQRAWQTHALIAGAILLAWAIHRAVEKPAMRLLRRRFGTKGARVGSPGSSAASAALVISAS